MRDGARYLPDFIGIGPGRTGTTWLHRVLESSVILPEGTKETQFFNERYKFGLDWYAWHFRRADGSKKIAEVCPYFNHRVARERIKQHLPNCRLICTIRNPVDHAYSVYKLMRHYVWTRTSFEDTLANRPHLDDSNRTAMHLSGWFDLFGRENVLVTSYEELRSSPQTYLNRVTNFVELPRIVLGNDVSVSDDVNAYERAPKNRHLAQNARHFLYWMRDHRAYRTINAAERLGIWSFCFGRGESFPPIPPELELELIQRWMPEIEALENLLDIDLSAWKVPRAARSTRRSASAA
jgi:hypothetical protein